MPHSTNTLLDNETLERSSIVANSLMNRERRCSGKNSYQQEIGFNPLKFLQKRLETEAQVAWLDFCCGEGNALVEAADYFSALNLQNRVSLVGVDLVHKFNPKHINFAFLNLIETSFTAWQTNQRFDLITCIHGLHYIGDKAGSIKKAVSYLKNDGIFLANLDLNNLRDELGEAAGSKIIKSLRRQGLEYNVQKRLLKCEEQKVLDIGFEYLGADDNAGANYTKQPAVNSFYSLTK